MNLVHRPATEAYPIIGLSGLWPVILLSLALLTGCQTTKHMAEVQDPFLPTKTVLNGHTQPVLGEVALKELPRFGNLQLSMREAGSPAG